jgi:hypothetical protein
MVCKHRKYCQSKVEVDDLSHYYGVVLKKRKKKKNLKFMLRLSR